MITRSPQFRARYCVSSTRNTAQRLLEANVRSFPQLVSGKVNRGIRDTLKGNPEHFMAFNNGIVVVADEIHFGRTADGSPQHLLVEGHADSQWRPDDSLTLLSPRREIRKSTSAVSACPPRSLFSAPKDADARPRD